MKSVLRNLGRSLIGYVIPVFGCKCIVQLFVILLCVGYNWVGSYNFANPISICAIITLVAASLLKRLLLLINFILMTITITLNICLILLSPVQILDKIRLGDFDFQGLNIIFISNFIDCIQILVAFPLKLVNYALCFLSPMLKTNENMLKENKHQSKSLACVSNFDILLFCLNWLDINTFCINVWTRLNLTMVTLSTNNSVWHNYIISRKNQGTDQVIQARFSLFSLSIKSLILSIIEILIFAISLATLIINPTKTFIQFHSYYLLSSCDYSSILDTQEIIANRIAQFKLGLKLQLRCIVASPISNIVAFLNLMIILFIPWRIKKILASSKSYLACVKLDFGSRDYETIINSMDLSRWGCDASWKRMTIRLAYIAVEDYFLILKVIIISTFSFRGVLVLWLELSDFDYELTTNRKQIHIIKSLMNAESPLKENSYYKILDIPIEYTIHPYTHKTLNNHLRHLFVKKEIFLSLFIFIFFVLFFWKALKVCKIFYESKFSSKLKVLTQLYLKGLLDILCLFMTLILLFSVIYTYDTILLIYYQVNRVSLYSIYYSKRYKNEIFKIFANYLKFLAAVILLLFNMLLLVRIIHLFRRIATSIKSKIRNDYYLIKSLLKHHILKDLKYTTASKITDNILKTLNKSKTKIEELSLNGQKDSKATLPGPLSKKNRFNRSSSLNLRTENQASKNLPLRQTFSSSKEYRRPNFRTCSSLNSSESDSDSSASDKYPIKKEPYQNYAFDINKYLTDTSFCKISEYLKPNDIHNLSLVCVKMYIVMSINSVWEFQLEKSIVPKLRDLKREDLIVALEKSNIPSFAYKCKKMVPYIKNRFLPLNEVERDTLISFSSIIFEETIETIMNFPHLILIPIKLCSILIGYVQTIILLLYVVLVYDDSGLVRKIHKTTRFGAHCLVIDCKSTDVFVSHDTKFDLKLILQRESKLSEFLLKAIKNFDSKIEKDYEILNVQINGLIGLLEILVLSSRIAFYVLIKICVLSLEKITNLCTWYKQNCECCSPIISNISTIKKIYKIEPPKIQPYRCDILIERVKKCSGSAIKSKFARRSFSFDHLSLISRPSPFSTNVCQKQHYLRLKFFKFGPSRFSLETKLKFLDKNTLFLQTVVALILYLMMLTSIFTPVLVILSKDISIILNSISAIYEEKQYSSSIPPLFFISQLMNYLLMYFNQLPINSLLYIKMLLLIVYLLHLMVLVRLSQIFSYYPQVIIVDLVKGIFFLDVRLIRILKIGELSKKLLYYILFFQTIVLVFKSRQHRKNINKWVYLVIILFAMVNPMILFFVIKLSVLRLTLISIYSIWNLILVLKLILNNRASRS